jgi:hypothetical protein
MSMQEMLLNRLKTVNPNGYKKLMELKQSGKDPSQALEELYKNGEISKDQLKQVQRQAHLFGINIPQSEIERISAETVEPKIPQSANVSKFKGWF